MTKEEKEKIAAEFKANLESIDESAAQELNLKISKSILMNNISSRYPEPHSEYVEFLLDRTAVSLGFNSVEDSLQFLKLAFLSDRPNTDK